MKKQRLLTIGITILLLTITACSKSIPNDNIDGENATISVSDVVSTNVAPGQDDTFNDEVTIIINNSEEKFDTIEARFIRKIEDETSAILQLASVSISNGTEKIGNYDVRMNIGHYSRVEYGRTSYSFDIGDYHFSVELNKSGDYTVRLW